ncbi:MAG: hypothetical protein ABI836_04100 [Gemmatimonadota bacterium]
MSPSLGLPARLRFFRSSRTSVLVDSALAPKPALASWDSILARPRC